MIWDLLTPKRKSVTYLIIFTFYFLLSACAVINLNKYKGIHLSQSGNDVPTIIVLLGHPGAGKGTFAQSLKSKAFIHLSIGDFLRNELKNKSDLGLRWKKEIDAHGILAVDTVKEVTADLIKKISSSESRVYILDGHVRTLEQAKHLNELLKKNGNIHSIFIFINTDKEKAMQRILDRRTCKKCDYIYNLKSFLSKKDGICDHCKTVLDHRSTDNKVHARNRIDKYEPHLKETVEYYKNNNVLIELNGNLPISEYILECRTLFD